MQAVLFAIYGKDYGVTNLDTLLGDWAEVSAKFMNFTYFFLQFSILHIATKMLQFRQFPAFSDQILHEFNTATVYFLSKSSTKIAVVSRQDII